MKSQRPGDYTFKSHMISITSGTKKVNKKLLAECTISRVILLPRVWGNEMRGNKRS